MAQRQHKVSLAPGASGGRAASGSAAGAPSMPCQLRTTDSGRSFSSMTSSWSPRLKRRPACAMSGATISAYPAGPRGGRQRRVWPAASGPFVLERLPPTASQEERWHSGRPAGGAGSMGKRSWSLGMRTIFGQICPVTGYAEFSRCPTGWKSIYAVSVFLLANTPPAYNDAGWRLFGLRYSSAR